jgi:hypothetical protein
MRKNNTIPEIISLLGDPDCDVQAAALEIVLDLAKHGRS